MAKLFINDFFTLMAQPDNKLKTKYIKKQFKVQGLEMPQFDDCKRNITKKNEKGTTIVKLANKDMYVKRETYNQIDLRIKTFEFLLQNNDKLKITKLGKRMTEEMSALYLLEALNTIKNNTKCIEKIQEHSEMSDDDAKRLYDELQSKIINIQQNTTNTNVEINSQEIKKADNNIQNNFAINDDIDDFDVDEYKVVQEQQDNKNKKVEENDNIKQILAYKWIYGKLRIEAYDANNKTSSKAEIKNLVKGDQELEKLYSDFTKGFAKIYQQKFNDKLNDKQNLKEQTRDIMKNVGIKFDNSAMTKTTNKRKVVKEKNRGFFGFFK